MIKFRNTLNESRHGDYVSPSAQTVLFHSEGILCSSMEGVSHEEFTEGGSYEIE